MNESFLTSESINISETDEPEGSCMVYHANSMTQEQFNNFNEKIFDLMKKNKIFNVKASLNYWYRK